MRRAFVFSVAAVTFFLAAGARAETLPEGFRFRRPLQFSQAVSDAPGQNAAWVEFYTNGEAKPDGADLRVTTADGTVVAHRILQIAPNNDFVRLAFATQGDGPYYVYWGNARAEMPNNPLEIQRGICTEIFRTPAGAQKDARMPDGLDRLFERARPALGAVFVPEIFLGYNPLGDEGETMFRYRGQFKIDTAITAGFAFTVADTGALTIDGKVVTREARGGMHSHVRDPKQVELSPGWHTIDVTQVNLDGRQTGVAVVWKRPRDRNYAPLPASMFAPIARAVPGALEKVGETGYVADFSIVPEAEAFAPPEWYLQRYTFDANIPATLSPKIMWDFGDGQIGGDLKRASHIYLVPGTYTVRLKVEQAGETFTASRRIAIKDRMYAKFPRPPEDSQKTVTAVLKDYRQQALTGDQAFRGMLYFKGKNDAAQALAWGKTWAALKDAPRGQIVVEEAFDLARMLEARKDFAGAADVFRAAAGKPVGMEQRVELMRYYVMTACDSAEDAAEALKFAQEWKKNINTASKPQVAGVRAAMLYAAIAKGDGNLAKSLVDEAASKDPPTNDYRERQIRQGVLARNIENYIRTKDYDTALKLIDDWESEFPDGIWEGFTRTLRVKLAVAEGRPEIAARIALQHARANPGGFYAAELLYRAGENFKAAKDEARSKEAMDILRSKYPESPYARGEK